MPVRRSPAPPPAPPEWLRRITPPAAQQQAPLTDSLVKSPAFTIWATVMSLTFGFGLLAVYAGSLGWAASVLLLYAATGRWLLRAARSGSSQTRGQGRSTTAVNAPSSVRRAGRDALAVTLCCESAPLDPEPCRSGPMPFV